MDALVLLQGKIGAERRPLGIHMDGTPRPFAPLPRRDALREARMAATQLPDPEAT